jgi:hypothetical protein
MKARYITVFVLLSLTACYGSSPGPSTSRTEKEKLQAFIEKIEKTFETSQTALRASPAISRTSLSDNEVTRISNEGVYLQNGELILAEELERRLTPEEMQTFKSLNIAATGCKVKICGDGKRALRPLSCNVPC